MSDTTTSTRTTPNGIDTLSPEESALLDSMRTDTGTELASEAVNNAPMENEPAPQATTDVVADGPDTDDETVSVNPKALHAERERRRAAEAKQREIEQKHAVDMARMQERMGLLTQAVQAAMAPPAVSPPAPEIPDITTDPVGHFKAKYEALERQYQDGQAQMRAFQQQQQQAQAVAELRNWGTAQESAFMAQEPAYGDAMKYLREGRHAELEAAGIADPAVREGIINGDVTQIALKSRQEGANFPERLYNIALKRGFQKAPVAPAVPPLDPVASAPTQAQRAEQGRQNATTIGSVGAAPPAALTAEKIASMPDHEFAAYMDKIKGNPTAVRQLLGA